MSDKFDIDKIISDWENIIGGERYSYPKMVQLPTNLWEKAKESLDLRDTEAEKNPELLQFFGKTGFICLKNFPGTCFVKPIYMRNQ